MIVYKVTNRYGRTLYGNFVWGQDTTYEIPDDERERQLCAAGIMHVYLDPDFALLAQPAHLGFSSLKVWEGETDQVVVTDGEKVGVWRLTTTKVRTTPDWYLDPTKRIKSAWNYARDLLTQLPESRDVVNFIDQFGEMTRSRLPEKVFRFVDEKQDNAKTEREIRLWGIANDLLIARDDWRTYSMISVTTRHLAAVIIGIAYWFYQDTGKQIVFPVIRTS